MLECGSQVGDVLEQIGGGLVSGGHRVSYGAGCLAWPALCHLVPGGPYSFVAALEVGRTSWGALLDAVRLGPADDATLV
ncbi:hypothetical protein PUR57_30660 [Streptomyces sp. JV176]|uniref:hypothetical protein n=1 Tax=Streptomyces sp. JV176 TaxID=858630 RepID=UPI002E7856F2|nr:hypothetical protein [Streptomyces sp. JV176]MEE1802978.1 hypothetical protein [Streptomyces sp. JV176]